MSAPTPPYDRIPPEIVSLDDYEAFARGRMDPAAWAYLAGGAADELTLRANREAYGRIRLRPRVLGDFRGANTRVELFGRTFAHPLLVAPMAFHRLAHPQGEIATAFGAAALEAGMVVSMQASVALEEIAAATAGPKWFQLYLYAERSFTESLVRRAEAAGYEALVVTVDAPVHGVRNREQRAGFRLPAGVEPVNLREMPPLPVCESPFDPAYLATLPGWDSLAWLKSITRLPVLLKGVLCADDAARAVAEGLDGVIVSNHGGRTLDTLPAAIDALPRVAERVAGRVPVLCDGGIRRGTDVLKALALGADAVLLGRPVFHGLSVAGATGVAHVLKILRTELEVAMLLAGCPTIGTIDRRVLW
jgi:4-hydroxymandelate oxidase